MIKNRLKKVLGLGILIGIRQGYFLLRNIYELYYQPYLTIKELVNKRDKSQIFLIIVAALTPVMIYILARVIYDLIRFGRLIALTGNVFLVMGIIQLVVLSYLGYWTLKVMRNY
jgi:predicted membrane channel-forming protein YqfA (hemolysin III family)